MPFPFSYTISSETTGPPSDPTAPGGLAAAIATALRGEELDFSQPGPLTFRIRKPWGTGWERSKLDPWSSVSTAVLTIEPTASGLKVRLTVRFTAALLITTLFGAGVIWLGFPWAAMVGVVLLSWVMIYFIGQEEMAKWLQDVTRRSNVRTGDST